MLLTQSTSVVLAKRCQIFSYLRRLLGSQAHRRHLASGFGESRIVDPGNEVSQRVPGGARGYCLTTHKMCKIGTEGAGGRCTGDGMAVHAGRTLEDPPPLGSSGADPRRPALLLNPAVESFRGVDVHTKQHQ